MPSLNEHKKQILHNNLLFKIMDVTGKYDEKIQIKISVDTMADEVYQSR